MSTLTRKQREVQQRELMLLDVARKILIEQGYAGLTMDRVAEATEYSKWTVYQHFATKEDLVAALLIQSTEHRLALFTRALTFQGRPRERLCALGVADELFTIKHPHSFRSEQIIKMADLENRASAARREAMERQDDCVMGWIRGVVDEAIAAGDLALPSPLTSGDLTFAMLAMVLGSHNLRVNHGRMLEGLLSATPLAILRSSIHVLLDGYGWKPLQAEWDYPSTYLRIYEHAFADEPAIKAITSLVEVAP
ncbi:TetR/AcrR family transcriptional regulator [Aquisphaera insulae]|uniref:TetR/AcrR family transcriptional regulator n=1 Tax=Aquisphaera insulae TaxID=2712864 RepID=UPI0013ED7C3B|nr:TetR/AcrR family transcriptional regulator [Aquisphaera insulae]